VFFRPIEEALEQHYFFVSAFYKGTTIITKYCLELISLKHSEIRILIGNGYINWIAGDMNKISPKALLHSKWTKVEVTNKEKHFVITKLTTDEDQKVIQCVIEAVMSKNDYAIDWRDLKNSMHWKIGWQ
jgi:tryptophan-rich hypothetical protein